MIKCDYITKNKEKNNPNWPQILNHPYGISVIRSSGSGKTNALLNLIKQQYGNYSVIDKICLYVKDPKEANYQYLIKNAKKVVLNDWKIQRLLLNIEKISRMSIQTLKIKTQKENMIVDMISKKHLNQILTNLVLNYQKMLYQTLHIN